MTVADNTSRNQYTATSGQTVFAYTFEIVDKDDIVVLKNGTTLSEGTNYTVSNVGNDSGGNVTLTVGATAGDILTLYRDMPYARTQNYTNSGDFLASEVNSDFDNLWLAGEQTQRSFSQSIRKPITDSDSISMELPEAADRLNSFLTFDSTGAVSVESLSSANAPSSISRQQFTGNGSTTVFTLAADAGVGAGVFIYIDGVYQESDTYTISGTTLTFTEAPPLNASIEVVSYRTGDINTADANAVTYLPAGTGAVQTTVQTKLRESVSVKDFGAVGDGVTDDSSAIQAAVDSARAVHFPIGSYNIGTTTITVSKTCKLYGDASSFADTNSMSRILYSGTGVALDIAPSSGRIYNSSIENLVVMASGGAASSATAVGLRFVNSNYSLIQNVVIRGFTSGTGLRFNTTSGEISAYNHVLACFIWGNKFGIDFSGVSGPTATGSGDYGTQIIGGSVIGSQTPAVSGSIGLKVDQYCAETMVYGTDFESFDICIDLFGNSTTSGGGVKLIATRTEFQTTQAVRVNTNTDRTQLIGHRFAGGAASTHLLDNGIKTFRTDPDAGVALNVGNLKLLNEIPIVMEDTSGIARNVLKLASNNTVQIGSTVNLNFGLGSWYLTAPTFSGADTATGWQNPISLGNHRLWVDSTGDLRIKNGAPTFDTDGVVVGTQS